MLFVFNNLHTGMHLDYNRHMGDEDMSRQKAQKGFTFIELALAVTITLALATMSVYVSGNVLRKNRLTNQLRLLKSTIITARAKSIEKAAPVRFSIDPDTGAMLVLLDRNRDGDFTDEKVEIIVGGKDGLGDIQPIDKNYPNVEPFLLATSSEPSGLPTLDHWTGGTPPTNFTNNEFILMPNGNVLDTGNYLPTSGAFFFRTSRGDAAGAVFISARGEIRTAYITEKATQGVWNDWVWHR